MEVPLRRLEVYLYQWRRLQWRWLSRGIEECGGGRGEGSRRRSATRQGRALGFGWGHLILRWRPRSHTTAPLSPYAAPARCSISLSRPPPPLLLHYHSRRQQGRGGGPKKALEFYSRRLPARVLEIARRRSPQRRRTFWIARFSWLLSLVDTRAF